MRLRIPIAIIVATMGMGAIWWFATQRPLAVAVASTSQDVPVTVFGLGSVEARVLSRVGFEVPGMLMEVLADHGDRVAAGTVLAKLNPATQQSRVARAEAAILSVQAALARSEAQRERAEAQLAQRRATAQRRRELANRGAGSVEAAELAETEVALAQADVGVNRADAMVARAALAEAEANLQAERTTLAKHTLIAPFDAMVIARTREPGTAPNPGEPVFTLVAPDSLWALAYVDEGRAGDIAVGQPARVTLRSRPGSSMDAEVVRIGLEADRVTEERRVYVRCRSCPIAPVIGEQAEVVIETGRLAHALLVPESAVHGFDGVSGMVWTVENGHLAQRRVRFAARLVDARLAITEALPDGVAVAVTVGGSFAVGRPARAVTP